MGATLLLIALIAAYFAPTLIAGINRRRNATAIFALNLLLGWSLIGWIVAFVWALVRDPEPIRLPLARN